MVTPVADRAMANTRLRCTAEMSGATRAPSHAATVLARQMMLVSGTSAWPLAR